MMRKIVIFLALTVTSFSVSFGAATNVMPEKAAVMANYTNYSIVWPTNTSQFLNSNDIATITLATAISNALNVKLTNATNNIYGYVASSNDMTNTQIRVGRIEGRTSTWNQASIDATAFTNFWYGSSESGAANWVLLTNGMISWNAASSSSIATTNELWWLAYGKTNQVGLRAVDTNTLSIRNSDDSDYGNLIVSNLTVMGTQNTFNVNVIDVETNRIKLNSNISAGAPILDAYIYNRRGDESNAMIKWNETTDRWYFGIEGGDVQDTTLWVSNHNTYFGSMLSYTQGWNKASNDAYLATNWIATNTLWTNVLNIQAQTGSWIQARTDSTAFTNWIYPAGGTNYWNCPSNIINAAFTNITPGANITIVTNGRNLTVVGTISGDVVTNGGNTTIRLTQRGTNYQLVGEAQIGWTNVVGTSTWVSVGLNFQNGTNTSWRNDHGTNILEVPSAGLGDVIAANYNTFANSNAFNGNVRIHGTNIETKLEAAILTNGYHETTINTLVTSNGTQQTQITNNTQLTIGHTNLMVADAPHGMTTVALVPSNSVFYADGRISGDRSVWGSTLSLDDISSTAYGSLIRGSKTDGGAGTGTGIYLIGPYSEGCEQAGSCQGYVSVLTNSYATMQRLSVSVSGRAVIGSYTHAAQQYGTVRSGATATNTGSGSIQIFDLYTNELALMTGVGSIGLGAATVTNDESLVAGDGNVSHGIATVTANGFYSTNGAVGFVGNGSGLTNIPYATTANTASNVINAVSYSTNSGTANTASNMSVSHATYIVPYGVTQTISMAYYDQTLLDITNDCVFYIDTTASTTMSHNVRFNWVASTNAITWFTNCFFGTNLQYGLGSGLMRNKRGAGEMSSAIYDQPAYSIKGTWWPL